MPDEEDNDEEMQQEVHEVEDMLEAQSESNEEAGGQAQMPAFQNSFEGQSDPDVFLALQEFIVVATNISGGLKSPCK
ncbi:hypothetical protein A2U01_0088317, partial [Trifolium medium]|nr:hypothetical protein [Trifolium medium]